MYAKDLARDDARDGERVEDVDKRLPGLDVRSAFAFVVESVHCGAGRAGRPSGSASSDTVGRREENGARLTSGDVRTLVIPPQQEEILRILDLVTKKQQDRLQRLFTPVDIIAEKEVVGGGRETAHLKETDQVGVLRATTSNDDWRVSRER